MTILERLRHLDAVSAPVTRQEVRAVLGAELDDASLRQGRVAAGVTAGSLASATGLDVDVAVVLGAADGTLPPPPRHDPLLADEFRARAGLTTADEWSARLEAGLLDVVATAATTITVPRGDLRATTERAPSRWLDRWSDEVRSTSVGSHTHGIASCAFPVSEPQRRLRDRLRVVRAGVPLDRERLDEMTERGLALRRGRDADRLTPYDGDLSGVTVPTLDELDEAVSPSRLEQWATCPHAYFVRYLLRVSPVEEPDRDLTINAMHRGSLQHEVLERFHRQVIDGHLPPPDASGWSSAHAGVLAGLFDDVADEWEAAGRTGRPATWAGERRRMRRDTLGWLDHDSRHVAVNGSMPIGVEWRFGRDDDVTMALPDGRRLVMQGAVDRVDVCADGRLVVTDHKTGKDSGYRDICADDPTLGGTVFQLPTYAAAAQALAAQMGVDAPGTVRAEYGMLGAGGYRRHGVVFDDEAWTRVLGQLQRVVDGIEAGWFPAQPARPGFRLYVPCWYCEPDGLGTTDQWRRWDRKRHDARIERWFGVPDPGGDDD